MVTDSRPHTAAAPDVFHALADPTRRSILDQLRDGAKPVHDIARGFPVSRPAISKHLRVLQESGLLSEKREGRERYYRLNPEPLRDVEHWLNGYRRFWAIHLASLKRHVEAEVKRPKQ